VKKKAAPTSHKIISGNCAPKILASKNMNPATALEIGSITELIRSSIPAAREEKQFKNTVKITNN
jgi:hypothetical protein